MAAWPPLAAGSGAIHDLDDVGEALAQGAAGARQAAANRSYGDGEHTCGLVIGNAVHGDQHENLAQLFRQTLKLVVQLAQSLCEGNIVGRGLVAEGVPSRTSSATN